MRQYYFEDRAVLHEGCKELFVVSKDSLYVDEVALVVVAFCFIDLLSERLPLSNLLSVQVSSNIRGKHVSFPRYKLSNHFSDTVSNTAPPPLRSPLGLDHLYRKELVWDHFYLEPLRSFLSPLLNVLGYPLLDVLVDGLHIASSLVKCSIEFHRGLLTLLKPRDIELRACLC